MLNDAISKNKVIPNSSVIPKNNVILAQAGIHKEFAKVGNSPSQGKDRRQALASPPPLVAETA